MAEDFLSRWSRRKLANSPEKESEAVEEAQAAEAEPDEAGPAGQESGGEEAAPHPAEAIDIDSLTRESDFTVFMQKGVPAALKRKALRKLWTSDPVFANLDGLDDYFDIAKPKIHGMGPIGGTNWQIGRGFLTEEEVQRAMGLAEKVVDAVQEAESDGTDRDRVALEGPDYLEEPGEAGERVAEDDPDAGRQT